MTTPVALLQLASPALPIGGYSYSAGLEWAIEDGQVRDEAGARAWIADALTLVHASFDGPLMLAALRALRTGGASADDVLAGLNAEALAARETVELRLESEQMGFSLGRWLQAVCPDPAHDDTLARRLDPLSLPVAWAVASDRLGLTERDALLGLLWSFVENQVMVLMKALPLGQIAAQRLLRSLEPALEAAIAAAGALPRARWSSAAPLLAVASARHETQYSRLFRS